MAETLSIKSYFLPDGSTKRSISIRTSTSQMYPKRFIGETPRILASCISTSTRLLILSNVRCILLHSLLHNELLKPTKL